MNDLKEDCRNLHEGFIPARGYDPPEYDCECAEYGDITHCEPDCPHYDPTGMTEAERMEAAKESAEQLKYDIMKESEL